jgi:predicted dienelactone hydrolase
MTSLQHRRRELLLTALGAMGLAWPGAVAASNGDETWLDAHRSRRLPVKIRWPDDAAGAGRPFIVHSHGLGGNREGGDAWGEAWRAAGFVVVHVQHPGSDTRVLLQGMAELRAAATAEQLIARVDDVRFVIGEVQGRAAARAGDWARVAADGVGVSGHSFGAQTVLALAGRRYPVEGPDLRDARVRAFIAFSPSLGEGGMSAQQQFGAIRAPMLLVTGSLDGDPFGRYSDGSRRAAVFDGLPPGQRALLWLDGADHMTFGGNVAQRIRGRGFLRREGDAAALEDAHHALVARASSDWWRAWLLGDDPARGRLAGFAAQLAPPHRWRQD